MKKTTNRGLVSIDVSDPEAANRSHEKRCRFPHTDVHAVQCKVDYITTFLVLRHSVYVTRFQVFVVTVRSRRTACFHLLKRQCCTTMSCRHFRVLEWANPIWFCYVTSSHRHRHKVVRRAPCVASVVANVVSSEVTSDSEIFNETPVEKFTVWHWVSVKSPYYIGTSQLSFRNEL